MNGKPLMIDGFCGLGGATEGFMAEGWECVGFDNERHDYGMGSYPGQLVLQDILTVHGKQFAEAKFLWFSPPCQFFSYCAMPWTRAKKLAAEVRASQIRYAKELELFNACFRIQREASEAAGHHIPMIVENVRGAIPWVGRSRWHYGSFHLWGDVPALMPITVNGRKNGEWGKWRENGCNAENRMVPHRLLSPGWRSKHYDDTDKMRLGTKQGGDCFNDPSWPGKQGGVTKHGSGPIWFDTGIAQHSSKSNSRKAASAQIAKIPFPLARHIARCFT